MTPRTATVLAAAWGEERKQAMTVLATMLGASPKGGAGKAGGLGELSDYDMTKMDKLSAQHMKELENRKPRGK